MTFLQTSSSSDQNNKIKPVLGSVISGNKYNNDKPIFSYILSGRKCYLKMWDIVIFG